MWSTIWTAVTGFFSGMEKQLIIIGLIAATVVGAYFYWLHLESKITSLQQQNTILTSTVAAQGQTINDLQNRFKQIQQQLNQLNAFYLAIDTQSLNLDKQFEFGTITATNEKVVETKINTLYNQIFQNIMKETQISKPGK